MITEKENKIEELENHIHSIYAIIGNMKPCHPLSNIPKETLIEILLNDEDFAKIMSYGYSFYQPTREDVLAILKEVYYEL